MAEISSYWAFQNSAFVINFDSAKCSYFSIVCSSFESIGKIFDNKQTVMVIWSEIDSSFSFSQTRTQDTVRLSLLLHRRGPFSVHLQPRCSSITINWWNISNWAEEASDWEWLNWWIMLFNVMFCTGAVCCDKNCFWISGRCSPLDEDQKKGCWERFLLLQSWTFSICV